MKSLLVVRAEEGDSFLREILADGVTVTFDLSAGFSLLRGLYFRGSGTYEQDIPVGVQIGPLSVSQIGVALTAESERSSLTVAVTGALSLGPLAVVVDGVGVLASIDSAGPGLLGSADLSLGFKRPDAIGLFVDAVGISGGGFIGHPATDRYEGLLNLKAGRVDIAAAGLLQTGLAGDPGYSLLIALHATFPAIQVGLGFALTGVGGLIGLNRRVDTDVLRNRLASGTAGRVLAPQDPIANAPALLADLQAVFPPTAGVHVVGPTVQLIWADLVYFDVGVCRRPRKTAQ